MGKNWPPWGCTVCREQNLVFTSHLGTQKICTRAAVVIYPCLSMDMCPLQMARDTAVTCVSLAWGPWARALQVLAVDVSWCLSLMFFHLWLFCNENVLVLLPSKHFDFHSKSFSKWFHIDCFFIKVKFIKYKLAVLKWRMWWHSVPSQYWAVNVSARCKSLFSHQQKSLHSLDHHYTSSVPQDCSQTVLTGLPWISLPCILYINGIM